MVGPPGCGADGDSTSRDLPTGYAAFDSLLRDLYNLGPRSSGVGSSGPRRPSHGRPRRPVRCGRTKTNPGSDEMALAKELETLQASSRVRVIDRFDSAPGRGYRAWTRSDI